MTEFNISGTQLVCGTLLVNDLDRSLEMYTTLLSQKVVEKTEKTETSKLSQIQLYQLIILVCVKLQLPGLNLGSRPAELLEKLNGGVFVGQVLVRVYRR